MQAPGEGERTEAGPVLLPYDAQRIYRKCCVQTRATGILARNPLNQDLE